MSAGAGGKEELRRLRRLVADLEAEREIARRLAAFQGGPAGRERIYRFISSESANFSVARLCQVCGVARSAYYDWLGRDRGGPSAALVEEAYLANRIFDIWRRARGRYGAPRVTAGLAKQGVEVNEKRVARLMGEMGITSRLLSRHSPAWRCRPVVTVVVMGHVADQVVDVEERLFSELADVRVLGRVERLCSFPPDCHQPGQSQLRQVLRNAGRVHPQVVRQLVHRVLAMQQGPDDLQPGVIRQEL